MTPKSPSTGQELTPVSKGVFSLWRSDDGSGVAITVASSTNDEEANHIFDLAAAGPLSPLMSPTTGDQMQRVSVIDEDDNADTITLDVDIEGRMIWFDAGEIEELSDEVGADKAASPDARLTAIIDGIASHLVRSSDDLPLHPTLAERLAQKNFGLVQFLARHTLNNVDTDD
jgi:hypothetical protein